MTEWERHRRAVWSVPNVTMTTINSTPSSDVLVNGCISNFNTIACVRGAILAFLAVLTAILCVLKVIKFHHARHQNWHQYFIFYCASLECTIAGIHWVLYMYVQFDFVLQWLKLSQFLVMCHFYWMLATRALRREVWTKRFLVPFLAVACTYFTTTAVLGIVEVQDTFTECFQPYWLMMSSAEFLIVQLFCVAGFYITRRLNEISTLDSVRRAQKRDLWCIVIVFEISALIGVAYDLTLRIMADRKTGCSAVFKHAQTIFSIIFFTFMVAKLLLPVWVMLFVFQPTPQVVVESDDLIPALTDEGNSAFSTNTDDQYRQLYHPCENYRTLSYDTPTSRSPVTNYAPASPVGTINAVMNGSTVNAYRPTNNANLGTIREESNSQQHTPNATVASHGARQTPKSHSISAKGSAQQPKEAGIVNKAYETVAKSGTEKSETVNEAGNQSQLNQSTGAGNQSRSSSSVTSKGEESSTDGQGGDTNQNAGRRREDVPKFSIAGTSDDSDTPSSPPKGKFYI